MATRRGFIQQGLMAGGALGLAGVGGLPAAEIAHAGQDGDSSLNIGLIIFPRMDQIDFTGPFEVLSRVPGAAIHVLWRRRRCGTSRASSSPPSRRWRRPPRSTCWSCRAAPGRRR